jgi:succinate dehydrogenase / fumarate reductase membrane anchor subunit
VGARVIDKKLIADPQTHYGSPRAATRTFMLQRITAALNVFFLVFLVWLVVNLAGAERAQMLTTVRNPFVAIVLALLIVNVTLHMRIGMREIIEDYMDEGRVNRLAMLLNDIFALAICLIGLISVATIMFWG